MLVVRVTMFWQVAFSHDSSGNLLVRFKLIGDSEIVTSCYDKIQRAANDRAPIDVKKQKLPSLT